MVAQRLKIPQREQARYGLLASARTDQMAGFDWSEGVLVCDDPCTDSYFIAPMCDKFLKWDSTAPAIPEDPVDPLAITFFIDPTISNAAAAIWTFEGAATTAPAPAVGASIDVTFTEPGMYYVEVLIPEDTSPARRQIWPVQIGALTCGTCREVEPVMLFTELVANGPFSLDELRDGVREALEATASGALERAAWAGSAISTPSLIETGLPVIAAAALSPVMALAGVEEALGAAQGTIHMSGGVANLLIAARLLEKDNGSLWTAVGGHQVVVGTGYDTRRGPSSYTLPDGTSATTHSTVSGDVQWMVAHSGGVWAWRGDVNVTEFFDQRLNRVTARAEQNAVVAWRGCNQVGAVVDLGA